MEPWITTFTGRRVNPLDIKEEDVCIEDIAHSLACLNRFNGHAATPISVAQHSVHASYLCHDTPHALQALLHDAAEAYLGDVTKWLKATPEMAAFRQAEDRAQRTIYARFGCALEDAEEVKAADKLLVRCEALEAFGEAFDFELADYPRATHLEREKVGYYLMWDWKMAEKRFLDRFKGLLAERR